MGNAQNYRLVGILGPLVVICYFFGVPFSNQNFGGNLGWKIRARALRKNFECWHFDLFFSVWSSRGNNLKALWATTTSRRNLPFIWYSDWEVACRSSSKCWFENNHVMLRANRYHHERHEQDPGQRRNPLWATGSKWLRQTVSKIPAVTPSWSIRVKGYARTPGTLF